ncbi:MAG: hypothetical protein JWP11_1311 [Frankiales bacterium]|nr:hypothetical protein [Frankiales bacterium]
MNDYAKVQQALAAGAAPAMLCATCPWDRFCLTPPTMTSDEVRAAIDKASAEDERKAHAAEVAGKTPGMPIGMLLTAVTVSGRDTSSTCCPVFSLRLRTSRGREAVDMVKNAMQAWDDER